MIMLADAKKQWNNTIGLCRNRLDMFWMKNGNKCKDRSENDEFCSAENKENIVIAPEYWLRSRNEPWCGVVLFCCCFCRNECRSADAWRLIMVTYAILVCNSIKLELLWIILPLWARLQYVMIAWYRGRCLYNIAFMKIDRFVSSRIFMILTSPD